MKTYKSSSYWVKASTKSIDLIDNSCIIDVANIDLTLMAWNILGVFAMRSRVELI